MWRNNDYTTGNLLDYEYFSKHYKLIAIDLSKQIELENPDLKQQINFIKRHVGDADNLDIIMPMYNSIEYSDNYSGTSGSLWQFKRDEQSINNGVPINVNTTNSTSFKYKSSLLEDSVADGNNRVFKNAKIAVPLKYLSNFWRLLEMPLINSKIHLELSWVKNCVMSNVGGVAAFKITNTKLYVPIVTLSSKDNVKLVKTLEERFKRPVYWNEYQIKMESINLDNKNPTRFPLYASFQGVRRLFVLAFNSTIDNDNNPINNAVFKNSHRKYFLPRVSISKYNVLIDGRSFCFMINQLMI